VPPVTRIYCAATTAAGNGAGLWSAPIKFFA
jgi:hypothetical protein